MTATTSGPQRDEPRGGAKGTKDQAPPEFRRVWLVAIVRGVLLLVLGLLLLIDPVRSDLDRMRWVFGAFMIADALVAALAAVWHRNQSSWQVWLTQSAVDVVLGVVVLAWPDLTAKALYYVLAAWVIALGVTLIVTAGVLARSRDLEWSWGLTAGVVSFLFGILLVFRQPDDDVQQTTALVFAFFAWVMGAIYVVTGFATRTLALELGSLRAQLAERGRGRASAARARRGGGGCSATSPRPARPERPAEKEKKPAAPSGPERKTATTRPAAEPSTKILPTTEPTDRPHHEPGDENGS
ncbi:hypothetical protein GCM10025864_19330 [Luteimicrobium album]|uniref:Uncharacterized protein n=1 Tax=Luteimicrobium album TaxID=1054550 RepID=A0ABQ6I0C9_9MICO|nr:DUF308 domain-containing protein [Luteimicrobium album]GMA24174.1 hypothetical protein GCM10025864_19330 [Luteimicrobium album]